MPLFIEDLQNVFGDTVLWFWDPESLDRVAGLWNPGLTGQRAFKVKAGWNSTPAKSRNGDTKEKSEKNVDIQINKAAIISEIKRLGGELITRIDVNK